MNRNLIIAAVMIYDAKDQAPTQAELREFFVREGVSLTNKVSGVTFDGCCQNAQGEQVYIDGKPVGVLKKSEDGKFSIEKSEAT